MPYSYRDDISISDAVFEAREQTLEALMKTAADAAMNVMIDDLDDIRPEIRRTFELGPEEVDLLLHELLEELIYYKDAEQLLLRVQKVRISKDGENYSLKAEAAGEKIDPDRHKLAADVKAVTLHRFEVKETEEGWRAFVILDI